MTALIADEPFAITQPTEDSKTHKYADMYPCLEIVSNPQFWSSSGPDPQPRPRSDCACPNRPTFYCHDVVETTSLSGWAGQEPTVYFPDDAWSNMDQRWNDSGRRKPKDSEIKLSQWHCVRVNPTWTDLGTIPGLGYEKPKTNCSNTMVRPLLG